MLFAPHAGRRSLWDLRTARRVRDLLQRLVRAVRGICRGAETGAEGIKKPQGTLIACRMTVFWGGAVIA